MKKLLLAYFVVAMSFFSQSVFSQESDQKLLGLPGDNLDLYAVLDLFQKSKTIEDFEKSLNEQKSGINNLDLDLDKKVDFIKVVTKKKESSFQFILQIAVSKTETQDVAVILVDKDKNGKVTMQIVGDKELYGKDYVVEPKPGGTSVTANPGYTGSEPVTKDVPATTTVVVEQAPIVQYVYSPAYVPYAPPYYYGYYPPYFAAFTVLAVGIYRSNNYYYHGHGGYGYHNTTVIHNHNNFNNYNNTRNTSNRVSHYNQNGNYNSERNKTSNRQSGGAGATNRPSTQPSRGGSDVTRPSTQPSRGGGSDVTRPSTQPSRGGSDVTRPSTTPSRSSGSSVLSGRTRSSGGGNYSGGGGGMRGGGGRRR